jgi:hypothetical protein
LLVNLSTLEVLLYQEDLNRADCMTDESYFSHKGRLCLTSGECCVVRDKEFLYDKIPGYLYRLDLKSDRKEYLGLTDFEHLGMSSHYGPIAWDRSGNVFRLIIDEDAPVTPPPSSSYDIRRYDTHIVEWPPRESTPAPAPATPPASGQPASSSPKATGSSSQ